MTILANGANAALPPFPVTIDVRPASALPSGLDHDVTLYLLGPTDKVLGDEGMVFYGMTETPDGLVRKIDVPQGARFEIRGMPAGIAKIAVAIVADDTAGGGRGLSPAGTISLTAGNGGQTVETALDVASSTLKAAILAEIYERNGQIKIRSVGQGFDGGLKPLSEHFGVTVADEAAPSAPAPVSAPVDLRKQRLVSLEKDHPKLVSLAKKATVSLEKRGVAGQKAKVCLILDVSGSMRGLFKSGAVQRLVERALAYGLAQDDDGSIDVILFDDAPILFGTVDASNYRTFVDDVMKRRDIWGTTRYAPAIRTMRDLYDGQPNPNRLPVFAMFVTDGDTSEKPAVEREIIDISRAGYFFKFMAIGEMPQGRVQRGRLPKGFDFLAYLDDMPGRTIDNADFFAVADPDHIDEDHFYELISEEWPTWLAQAKSHGMIA